MSVHAGSAQLATRLEVPVKARDCWWTVLVIDPIAVPLVRALHRVRGVTPNVLTALSVVIALGAGAAFASGQLVVGALLFQASFLVDCMDGKLASTRGVRSRYGSYIDAVGDGARFVVCTAGLILATAPHADGNATALTAVLAMFPTLHYVRLSTQAAWPDDPPGRSLSVAGSPLPVLRASLHRLSKPGTTVDTEAIAFTIGPLLGYPLEGILAAAAIDGLRLSVSISARVWKSTRPVPESP